MNNVGSISGQFVSGRKAIPATQAHKQVRHGLGEGSASYPPLFIFKKAPVHRCFKVVYVLNYCTTICFDVPLLVSTASTNPFCVSTEMRMIPAPVVSLSNDIERFATAPAYNVS